MLTDEIVDCAARLGKIYSTSLSGKVYKKRALMVRNAPDDLKTTPSSDALFNLIILGREEERLALIARSGFDFKGTAGLGRARYIELYQFYFSVLRIDAQ